jgi:hypothetical protein
MVLYCSCGKPILVRTIRRGDGQAVPSFFLADPSRGATMLLRCPSCAARLSLYALTSSPLERDFLYESLPSEDETWLLRED